jgi:uncharacterized FlaG/YvyC family protein
MGMDGLSFANTGAIKEQTSAEYTNKVEQSMALDPSNTAQQVHSLDNNKRVKEKEENEEEGGKRREGQPQQNENEFQDGLIEEPKEEETPEFHVEDFENPDKEFYVKLNIKDDIIELYDSSSNRLIETISGNELGELVQKLNMASGIFVNKKV